MMPHTASATYTGRQWLPSRVARRMIARHGAEVALVRVGGQQEKHKRRMRAEERRASTPFLVIYWDIVSVFIAKRLRVPQPIGSAAA